MRPLLLLMLLPLAFSGCRRSVVVSHSAPRATPAANTMFPGSFLTTAGSWTCSDSKGTATLSLTLSGETVNWNLELEQILANGSRLGGLMTSGMSLTSAGDPWFVHVETPLRFWFFDGTKNLAYSVSKDGHSESAQAISDGKLQPQSQPVPAEVIRRLPEDLQKLFPAVPPAGNRPSI